MASFRGDGPQDDFEYEDDFYGDDAFIADDSFDDFLASPRAPDEDVEDDSEEHERSPRPPAPKPGINLPGVSKGWQDAPTSNSRPGAPNGPPTNRPTPPAASPQNRPGTPPPGSVNRPGMPPASPGAPSRPTTTPPPGASKPGTPPAQRPGMPGKPASPTRPAPNTGSASPNAPRPGMPPGVAGPQSSAPSRPPTAPPPGSAGSPASRPNQPPEPGGSPRPGQPTPPTSGSPSGPARPATSTPPASKQGGGTPSKPGAGRSPAKPAGTSPAQPGSRSPSKPGAAKSPSRPGSTPDSASKPGSRSPSKPAAGRAPTSPRATTRAATANGALRGLPGVQGVKVKARARKAPVEPAWVRRIQSEMPPYADEIIAFALVGIGLLSFFTLLSPASGALGTAWSGTLKHAFGLGSFVISGVILAAGALMLLPKLNVEVKLNWYRIIAGEIVFIFALAFLHATIRASIPGEDGRIEAFARAFEGRGGGMVGWAIQDIIHALLGDVITGAVLLGIIAISGAMMIGVRRQQILDVLTGVENRFLDYAERMDQAILQRKRLEAAEARADRMSAPFRALLAERRAAEEARAREQARLVELPSLPGRPSLITGSTGAGALTLKREGPLTPRELYSQRGRLTPEERAKTLRSPLKMRFKVNEIADRKKLAKRDEGLPGLDLLDTSEFGRPSEVEINVNAQIIEETVEDFGMRVQVIGVKSGPTVTQYAVQPFVEVQGKDGEKIIQRVRVSRVAALGGDLALALAAPRVRIQAPVPGTQYIGIEVPNTQPGIVALRPVVEAEQFFRVKSPLAVALGREVDGTPFAVDLATMPHLLIGGTTGSGKSVCITSIAACLIANNRPDQLKLVMIDPKMVELVRFNGVPHLLGKVEVELDRIIGVLRWVTREMDRRYKLMEEAQARNIAVYNAGRKKKKERLPYMVVLIDELAELMTTYHDETEHLITRLAQMARATGIHLVVATQRPSTDVVTGLIKANFPSRIAFAVPSGTDSRVIIDSVGAEDLIGRGDMLYQGSDAAGPIRLQGCFVNDREMDRIVEFWRSSWKEPDEYGGMPPWEKALTRQLVLDETDAMLEDAIRVCQQMGEVSASLLQRRLNLGYPRAGRIVDALFQIGVVGPDPGGGRPRQVLIAKDVDPATYLIEWRMGR